MFHEEIELSDEENRIIDAVWDEIGRKEQQR
jgi:hypothetical protein